MSKNKKVDIDFVNYKLDMIEKRIDRIEKLFEVQNTKSGTDVNMELLKIVLDIAKNNKTEMQSKEVSKGKSISNIKDDETEDEKTKNDLESFSMSRRRTII